MKCEKSGNHTISYQSLLLSTTVLNDKVDCSPGIVASALVSGLPVRNIFKYINFYPNHMVTIYFFIRA